MTPHPLENLTKATQCAELLAEDIRSAHQDACRDHPLLAMLLLDLIRDSVTLKNRLAEIKFCLDPGV